MGAGPTLAGPSMLHCMTVMCEPAPSTGNPNHTATATPGSLRRQRQSFASAHRARRREPSPAVASDAWWAPRGRQPRAARRNRGTTPRHGHVR